MNSSGNDSPSPKRRSRGERNKQPDLNEYLQLEDENEACDENELNMNTHDELHELQRHKDENKININDSYQNQTYSNKNSAEKQNEASNINDLLFTGINILILLFLIIQFILCFLKMIEYTGSSLSFATKSPEGYKSNRNDVNLDASESKKSGSINASPINSSPKEEFKPSGYLRTTPGYKSKYSNKDKVPIEKPKPSSQIQFQKPKTKANFNFKSPKAKSSEELKSKAKEEVQEVKNAKNEFDKYLQFLVSKYEELEDKSEVEDLILELNRISKDNKGIIPQFFKVKLEKFSKRWIKSPSAKRLTSHTVSTNQMIKISAKGNVRHTKQKTHNRKMPISEEDTEELPAEIIQGNENLSDFIRVIQSNDELMKEYVELVKEYEESRSEIKAKTLMTFKSLASPSKIDTYIGVVLLYYFYQIDDSILLRNDKRQLEDKSWNYIKDYLSSWGKVVINMKKILPFMEDK